MNYISNAGESLPQSMMQRNIIFSSVSAAFERIYKVFLGSELSHNKRNGEVIFNFGL